MKLIAAVALALGLSQSKLYPHKECTKGSDEVCQTILNMKGDEVPSPDSCCMYMQVLSVPDLSGMSDDA